VSRKKPGTAVRLAAILAVVLTVVLSAVVLATVRTFAAQQRATVNRALVAETQGFANAAQARSSPGDFAAFTQSYLRTRVLPDGETVVIAIQGVGRFGSVGSDDLLASPEVRLLRTPPETSRLIDVPLPTGPVAVLEVPVTVSGQRLATVLVASDLSRLATDRMRMLLLASSEAARPGSRERTARPPRCQNPGMCANENPDEQRWLQPSGAGHHSVSGV